MSRPIDRDRLALLSRDELHRLVLGLVESFERASKEPSAVVGASGYFVDTYRALMACGLGAVDPEPEPRELPDVRPRGSFVLRTCVDCGQEWECLAGDGSYTCDECFSPSPEPDDYLGRTPDDR